MDVRIIGPPSGPDDAIQLRFPVLPLVSKLSVRKGRFFCLSTLGPCRCGLTIELHGSVPHQLLEASEVFVVPMPTQGFIHLIELLDVFFVCTHHSKINLDLLFCKILWLHRRPSRSIMTHGMEASYISLSFLESGA